MKLDKKALRNFILNIDNMDLLKILAIINEVNSWYDELYYLNYHENNEEFFNSYFEYSPMEAVKSAYYGKYNYMHEYVRIDEDMNLESKNKYELKYEIKTSCEDIIEVIRDMIEESNIYINHAEDFIIKD